MKRITYHTGEKPADYKESIPPSQETWNWVESNGGDIHIFEDSFLPEHVKYPGKIKIACLVECPAIYDYCTIGHPHVFHPYRWIKENHQHFDIIMSPFIQLKELVGDKYWWIPAAGIRILPEDVGMYQKERLLSIVASHKQWTVGHKLRHEIVTRYTGKMDAYGSGYNDIINNYKGTRLGKVLALAPYHYSFAIMNAKFDGYFTEILNDVLLVGTIPIFWGASNIGEYFNPDGIIQFNTIEELDMLLLTLTPALYQSKIGAITENIEKAKAYNTRFDWMYNNYKAKLEAL